MNITAQSLRHGSSLSHATQVRFTPEQYELIRRVSERTEQKLSTVIRGVVVAWAVNHINDQQRLAGEPDEIDVEALVAELNALAAEDADA